MLKFIILKMTLKIHRSEERGKSELDWLQSRFSFSFDRYYNPERKGFGKLLVLNDDIIAPKKGFGAHSHDNMEIITIPIEGELIHRDSTGVEEIILPKEIQVMSAGSGIVHSEYNNSNEKALKLFQIWIETKEINIIPRHNKKRFELNDNSITLVVSGKREKDTLYIHQNAKISLGKLEKDHKIDYSSDKNQGTFIFIISGSLEIEDNLLNERDSIEITELDKLNITSLKDSYFIIIEVPLNKQKQNL